MKSYRTYLILVIIGFLSCRSEDTVFEILPSSHTNIQFANKLEKHKVFGILYYLYYYNGGGVAIGDINNDGLTDIYFSANSNGANKLYLNKGDFKFEDITEKAGVKGIADWCSGVTMADVNGDGYLDIYVCAVSNSFGLKGKNQLYINNKNGTFTESAATYGLDFSGFSTQAAFFDYDHDGDLDCYLLNQSHARNENIPDTGMRRKYDPNAGDRLFRNDMNTAEKKFSDVSSFAGLYQSSLGYGLGLSIADFNNDGWEDVYVGNDFHENDYYYLNNGNGTFTESGAKHFNHYSRFSMGNDAADYNNDGQLDIVTVDMLPPDEKTLKTYGSDENPDIYRVKLVNNGYQYQYSKNCLQQNNGSGNSFSETALLSGVSATDWSWAPLFADFDNDGNKDLFISSGIVKRPVDLDYIRFVSNIAVHQALNQTDKFDDQALEKMPDGSSHPFLFKGDGNLSFKDVSDAWGTGKMKGYYNGAAYADLDNDGRLDLVINCIDAPAVVLKNNAPQKNYLSILFKGDGLNTNSIGAKAYLFSGDKMQYQQLMLTRGFQSSCDTRLHFGLDSAGMLDSVLIVWPNQRCETIRNVKANQLLQVSQKNAAGIFVYSSWFKEQLPLVLDKTDSITCNWRHKEDGFDDFNVQYLIPHAQSTRGPKIAVADINGDGLDDFYACGAKGQAGALMVQQLSGNFLASDTAIFNPDAGCEDVDALFFDANGDNYKDLYVVSGGNELKGNNPGLLDRLYLNDGKGHFKRSMEALPAMYASKSCVSAADVDKDGDNDLFIGTLADPVAYGYPQTSFLFLNNGQGKFSLAGPGKINLREIGMVTASAFADINNDGWQDLVVTGEWMPLTIFINNKSAFTKQEIPNSTGLWQSVFVDDVNKDGKPDILAGNWGHNNKFWSGKNGPLKMYVSDYNKNGMADQLVAYTIDGKEYPFLAKDEVERPLPQLKKHYLLYAEYAGVPMKDVFYGWIDTIKPMIAERLGSAVCYGDGKGGFAINDLPAHLQLAPVFSFQKLPLTGSGEAYLAGGNFFDVIPYEGRYDAQPLALFKFLSNKVTYIRQPDLLSVKGQVRDIKWLHKGKGNILLVARNNEPLLFYAPAKQ
ncbi:VCBS repeat-containing protein [Foetidibacter luteolus]|uniref:VCBS repeat-containing protein n=1 Tax=Foetidibacter luteolus TaxID=2608880 RepID=UPI00129A9562|nr:VCBS repeat-containing protein [Foetidibacter luteolus]